MILAHPLFIIQKSTATQGPLHDDGVFGIPNGDIFTSTLEVYHLDHPVPTPESSVQPLQVLLYPRQHHLRQLLNNHIPRSNGRRQFQAALGRACHRRPQEARSRPQSADSAYRMTGHSASKMLSLSNDGSFCVIGGGADKPYFYLIDIVNHKQLKLTSTVLTDTLAPCFINGDAEFVAIGGDDGQGVEIWDVKSQQPIRTIEINGKFITCSFSANNILLSAIGWTQQGALKAVL